MPKIVDHEERRQEFAAAALRVAIKHGVDGLTIRAVARESGASTGALAHYFKTKDDLLVAVQRLAGEASVARIQSCFERFEGRALIEEVVLTVLPLDEPRRGEWRLWLAYFARAAAEVELARVQRDYYSSWRTDLRRAYRFASGPGREISRAELERGTDAAMALIQGLGVLGMFEPAGISAARQKQLVRAHFDRWLL
jgi:AcrR family transcriptional regulator